MNKVLKLQGMLLKKIAEFEDSSLERDYPLEWEKIHMVSCARIGYILALKRGVDPELAAIACALHDYGRIVTGKQQGHAPAGYEPLKAFLNNCDGFPAEKVEILAQAAKNHSNKQDVGTQLEEIVKDADVLDCYQYGQALAREEQRKRLKKVLEELNL